MSTTEQNSDTLTIDPTELDDDAISPRVALEAMRKREVFAALEQLYKAQDHRIAVLRDLDRVAGNDPEKMTQVSECRGRAHQWVQAATRRVALAVLRAGGNLAEAAGAKRNKEWDECGIRTDGRIVIVGPATQDNGDVDYDLCSAIITECPDDRLAELEDAPRPKPAPKPWRSFRIHDTHPATEESWTTEEGRGTTLEDAIGTAKDQIRYELEDDPKNASNRVIWEQDEIVARVTVHEVRAELASE